MNRVKEEIHMKEYIKNNWKFLIFVLISGLIGGYCTGLYIPEMYSQEMLQQLQGQGMTTEMLALSGAVQYGMPTCTLRTYITRRAINTFRRRTKVLHNNPWCRMWLGK